MHIGDYLLLARKRKKIIKLQFNWTGPYRAVKPLRTFIWKIESLDRQRTLEVHVQRLKRYSDASLNAPQRPIEEVRGKQEQYELDHFVAWQVQRDTLRVELKCRWMRFSEVWDTFEDVEYIYGNLHQYERIS